MSGPKICDLPSLPVKISSQLARYIQHSRTAVVITEVHLIVFDPHVVRTGFGDRILGDLPRICNVGNIDDMKYPADGNAGLSLNIEDRREDLVAYEHVILVSKNGVRPGEPAVPVKLVMIESKLADERGLFGTASL